MTSTRHEELIARLEASSGDRELDALLWLIEPKQNGYEFIAYSDDWKAWTEFGIGRDDVVNPDARVQGLIFRDDTGQVQAFYSAPRYSTSIDAALTLLEPGYVAVSLSINEHGQSSARIGPPYVYGNGATPAIALCVASLRARASLKARTAR